MEEFKWYMDNDDIELSAGEAKTTDASGVKLDGAQFISTHPEQDSLSFFSSKAKYDLKNKVIYADGVKFINVAVWRMTDKSLFTVRGDCAGKVPPVNS